jgi:hypothetical protein
MEPQPQYDTEPVPRYYIYLEVTESFHNSSEFDYIVVHCINPGQVQIIESVQDLDEAIDFLYPRAVRDIPWSEKVSISFAPPWGQIVFDKDSEMRFFAKLPQAMQTHICEAFHKRHTSDSEETE